MAKSPEAARRELIANDIRSEVGNFPSIADLERYFGWGKRKVSSFFADVPSYDTGKERHYFAIDIARKIEDCRAN